VHSDLASGECSVSEEVSKYSGAKKGKCAYGFRGEPDGFFWFGEEFIGKTKDRNKSYRNEGDCSCAEE
jgi:hypothetical protein